MEENSIIKVNNIQLQFI